MGEEGQRISSRVLQQLKSSIKIIRTIDDIF